MFAAAVHSFHDDALGDMDAVALAEAIRQHRVSVGEVVAASLARADAVNSRLNAIAFDAREMALLTALGPRREGPFGGVPTYVKDNIDVRGMPTNQGSRAYLGRPAAGDDAFARQFLAQGFVTLGKSRLPEFGLNASTEFQHDPPTRNPWHLAFSAGASSGGAAALVAAGVVPIAHANDGGGSIRIPAACCGLVGLKPTRGRLVDGDLGSNLPVKIKTDGIVSRSVRDTAWFYAAAERYFAPKGMKPIGLVASPASRRLRIGLVLDSVTGRKTDDATRATVLAAARLLSDLGHHVEEMVLPLPSSFAEDFSLYWGLVAFGIVHFGKSFTAPDFDAKKLDGLTLGLARHYRRNLLKTPAMLHRLRKSAKLYAEQFGGSDTARSEAGGAVRGSAGSGTRDLILSPVLCHTTPRLGHLSPALEFGELFQRLQDYAGFTPWNNATGGPALTLPMGATEEGLPIGVHFSAAHGDERTLLELAYELESAAPWRRIQATRQTSTPV